MPRENHSTQKNGKGAGQPSQPGSHGTRNRNKAGASILIVEDDRKMGEALTQILSREGHEVALAESGEVALNLAAHRVFDLVITDFKLPGMDGIDVLKAIRQSRPHTSVILVTAYASVDSAVRAMKEGADDYLAKPFGLEDIRLVVHRVLSKRELELRNRYLEDQLKTKYRFEGIVGTSEAMVDVFKTIQRVKDSKATVLIQGETGTGKEMVAKAIHYNSVRASNLFLPVNCAALADSLYASELFGYVKGAFTGATRDKAGLFEVAQGGTVFLDEIGDISPVLQNTLLRVLEDGEIQPVGSSERRKVDVRVIAATNRNLDRLVQEERFREDLYYRLAVIVLRLPPLRERRHDIALLADHFLARYGAERFDAPKQFTPQAMQLLEAYLWPGNVRELENAVERAVLLETGSEVSAASLPPKVRESTAEPPPDEVSQDVQTLEEVGRGHIVEILKKTGGNKARAAEILGINRTSLWRMMRRLDIDDV